MWGKGSEEFANMVVESYMDRYATEARLGRQPTNEDIARIHNGGPNGFMRNSTLSYWEKVRRAYDDISRNKSDMTSCNFMCNNNECCGSTGCNCLDSSGMIMPCNSSSSSTAGKETFEYFCLIPLVCYFSFADSL